MMMELDQESRKHLKKQEKQNRERTQLLEIFPEELWIQVLETCGENADTLIGCSNASFFWRELLESKKSMYLFPHVLKILIDEKYLTHDHSADLLQLRLVCKTWRLAVNTLLEAPSHQKPLHFQNYRHIRTQDLAHPTYLRLYLSDPPETWEKFESELLPQLDSPFYKDGDSPFPSRTLEIFGYYLEDLPVNLDNPWDIPNNYRQWERNLSLVEHLLLKGGPHIWSFTLSICESYDISPRQWYLTLCKFVSLMPNLKSLYITNGPNFGRYGLYRLDEGPPFPPINTLELLSMENVPERVMKSICLANNQIKICIVPSFLDITSFFRTPLIPPWTDQTPRRQPLEEFDFGYLRDPHTIFACLLVPDYFEKMPDKWKLKVLCMDLSRCSTLKLPGIFKKLESYKESLDEVQISVANATRKDDKLILWETSRTPLHLPKLARLEIQMRNICSLDFLLGLMSLEYLGFVEDHNEMGPPSRGTKCQRIDFQNGVGRRQDFMRCNIWNYIPSLKKVEIKFAGRSSSQSYRRGESQ